MPSRVRASSFARDRDGGVGRSRDGARGDRFAGAQRARIVAATFSVCTDHGAANTSVAQIVERAGVSRRTFYEQFNDREECLLAAFEQALAQARGRVLFAYEAERDWSKRVRAGLVALLRFMDEEPAQARLLLVESLSGGTATLKRREEVMSALAGAIDQGQAHGRMSAASPLAAEGLVGGVLGVIHSRLSHGGDASLVELVNPLMSMIVLPYKGAGAAVRELRRSKVKASGERPRIELSRSDPFKDAGMRFTYRTVRVLAAIAEQPGASNRAIADAAEIKDQGQMSKLLTRLQRVRMIVNTASGSPRGGPNAWVLTASGWRVVATIREHAEGVSTGSSGVA